MKPSLIVHPVSYSPSGKIALATAVALARVSGADLHVLELTGRRRSSQDPIVRPIADADVEPHFAEFVRSVYSADVKISTVELVGDVVDAVVDYARSASADLVVVADQARSHGPYWRRGMYANDLARHLSIPLVSVPASREERLAREGASSEEAKSHAQAIARMIEWNMLAKASSDVKSETLVKPGTIGEGTLKAAGEAGADVIVVARPGAHHQVSMSSSLARVLRNAPRPVLVVPATAANRIRASRNRLERPRMASSLMVSLTDGTGLVPTVTIGHRTLCL
jgi:nucleotide-binding universal stress UspA family protein